MLIYKAKNDINGKSYIGQTKFDLEYRKRNHKLSHKKIDTDFYLAIRKYGWNNFSWEILERVDSDLDEREIHYIEKYNTINEGYNMTKRGTGRDHVLRDMILKTPKDMVFTTDYFNEYSISRQSVSKYVESGWLEKLRSGLYKKKYANVSVDNLLYTLNKYSNTNIHIGGRTAIAYNGSAHYVRFNEQKHLFGTGRLRTLFKYFQDEFKYYNRNLFDTKKGIKGFVSTDERSCLEMVYGIGIDEYENIISGMNHLRPKLLQELLEDCKNIESKRLLLHFGNKYSLSWFNKINIDKVELGSGKRQVRKGGKLDKKFNIVV